MSGKNCSLLGDLEVDLHEIDSYTSKYSTFLLLSFWLHVPIVFLKVQSYSSDNILWSFPGVYPQDYINYLPESHLIGPIYGVLYQ